MEPSLRRTFTLEKIDRSIHECLSLEQIDSTEQFLSLYYKQFAFNLKFLKQEWELDTQIINRRKQLDNLDDDKVLSIKGTKSLKRLENYIKSLSKNEFETEWMEIENQLKDIDLENTNVCALINERISALKHISTFAFQNTNKVHA